MRSLFKKKWIKYLSLIHNIKTVSTGTLHIEYKRNYNLLKAAIFRYTGLYCIGLAVRPAVALEMHKVVCIRDRQSIRCRKMFAVA